MSTLYKQSKLNHVFGAVVFVLSSMGLLLVRIREKPIEPMLVLLLAVLVFQGVRFVRWGNRPAAEIEGSYVSLLNSQSGRHAEFFVEDIEEISRISEASVQIVVSGTSHKAKGRSFAPGELERFYNDLVQLHDT